VGLYTRRPFGRLGRIGLACALVGSLVGAAGVAMMACFPSIQDILSQAAIDCGPIGWLLSGLGTAALYIGLVLFGSATVRRRVLPRWNALPLVMGLLGLGGLPVGYVGMAVDGLGLARLLDTTTLILFGLCWVALGYVLWSDNDERAKQPEVAA